MDKDLLKTLTQDLNKVTSKNDLMNLKSKFLGKKGLISELTSELKNLSIDEKKNRGAEINSTKKDIEIAIGKKLKDIEEAEINKKLNSEKIDITLPGKAPAFGSLHPITQVLENVIDIFEGYGFQTVEGPEVETNFYNFEALNIPENHPARDMQDTFYLDDNQLLRTHTSPMQVRIMENNNPPIKIISPGKVYRCDSDVTHTPMFHQVEGLFVDENVSFANLKSILNNFCIDFFKKRNKN
jgi:Phenylalanyl-tRNA synthetase alpha subunit